VNISKQEVSFGPLMLRHSIWNVSLYLKLKGLRSLREKGGD
jgi:hypothetical protein